MRWLNNISMAPKLIGGFLLVALPATSMHSIAEGPARARRLSHGRRNPGS